MNNDRAKIKYICRQRECLRRVLRCASSIVEHFNDDNFTKGHLNRYVSDMSDALRAYNSAKDSLSWHTEQIKT